MILLTPQIALGVFLFSALILLVLLRRGFYKMKKITQAKAKQEIFLKLSQDVSIHRSAEKKPKTSSGSLSTSSGKISKKPSRGLLRSEVLALLKEAETCLYRGKQATAEAKLIQAIALDPHSFEAYLMLTKLYITKENWKKAELLAMDAEKLKQDSFDLQVALGRIYAHKGQYKQALDKLLEASRQIPGDTEVLLMLSELYIQSEDLEQARGALIAAIKLKPRELSYYERLVLVLLRMDEGGELKQTYQRILAIQPYNQAARKALAAIK